jgi:hypothetical protein
MLYITERSDNAVPKYKKMDFPDENKGDLKNLECLDLGIALIKPLGQY